jgi:U3 small nucleolar RNA-associated protein 12
MKVWDLSTQHCVQTTIAHRSEVWSLDINPEKTLIFTGSGDGEMKVWRVDSEALSEGLKENESGEVILRPLVVPTAPSNLRAQITKMIHPVTTIPLSSKHRISQLSFHPRLQYLAVQSHDRSVEIFRIRTEEEIRKKQARRKKRAREKKKEKGQTEPGTGDEENEGDDEIDLVELFTPYLIVRSSGKIRSFYFGGEATTDAKGNTQVCHQIPSPALSDLFSDFLCTRLECLGGSQYPPTDAFEGTPIGSRQTLCS